MVRQYSLGLAASSYSVTVTGVGGSPLFGSVAEYVTYQEQLLEQLLCRGIGLHAYVLLPHTVHLLLTPLPTLPTNTDPGLAELPTGCGSTRARCKPWATVTRLANDREVLRGYRRLESMPQRQGLVAKAADWFFSSHRRNALGRPDPLVTPHRCYLDLGRSESRRLQAYRRYCEQRATALVDTLSRSGVACGSWPGGLSI